MTKQSRFAGIADMRRTLPGEGERESPRDEKSPAKMGRPPGKTSNPLYAQVTVYLRKDIHRTARKLLFDEGRQFSDLVDELVSRWVTETQKSEGPKV